MRKLVFGLLVVGAFIVYQSVDFDDLLDRLSWNAGPPITLSGFYEQEREDNLNPPFGLNFISSDTAEMYHGKEKLGNDVTYDIIRKKVIITHACGVWDMRYQDGKLYHKKYRCYFRKK